MRVKAIDAEAHVKRLLKRLRHRPDLGNSQGFMEAWQQLGSELALKPLFGKELADEVVFSISFGEAAIHAERQRPTPSCRRVELEGLNCPSDYLCLAVARQMAIHAPERVCNVHCFEEVYGGRILTDIVPQAQHQTYDGGIRQLNHLQEVEEAMRLHCDDADLPCRAPWQLLFGIRNKHKTKTVLAPIPSDQVLAGHGIDTKILRQDLFRHRPPAIAEAEPPLRPVLWGSLKAPCVQADKKSTTGVNHEAKLALEGLFRFLERHENQAEVAISAGEVLIFNNHRVLHGRGPLQPVEHHGERRWLKRLWMSSPLLDSLQPVKGHCRVFNRQEAFQVTSALKHP